MRSSTRIAVLCIGLCSSFAMPSVAQQKAAEPSTFTNPILDSGPDPWVLQEGGFYYFTHTTAESVTLWRTRDMADLRTAENKVIWKPDPGHPWKQTWAPEIHRWGDKWYVYFAAVGNNSDHRIYVLENAGADPMTGKWTLKGKVADATNKWSIDASTFELNGKHYLLWSGWKGDTNGLQVIYIARLTNPWTVGSARTLISEPTYDWEKHGDVGHGNHVYVNEGPEALIHGDRVWVFFSASGCWTPYYSIGAISAKVDSDLLDPKSWTKLDHPLLQQDPSASVFGPGHNGFFKSPDGKQDWIVYHANPAATDGCGDTRSTRMQPFTWNADGTPEFGKPVPTGKELPRPSR